MNASVLLEKLLQMQSDGIDLEGYDIDFCFATYGGVYYDSEFDCFEEENNCIVLKENQEYIENEMGFAFDQLLKLRDRIDEAYDVISKKET